MAVTAHFAPQPLLNPSKTPSFSSPCKTMPCQKPKKTTNFTERNLPYGRSNEISSFTFTASSPSANTAMACAAESTPQLICQTTLLCSRETGKIHSTTPNSARAAPTTTYDNVPVTHHRNICSPERHGGSTRPKSGRWCSSRRGGGGLEDTMATAASGSRNCEEGKEGCERPWSSAWTLSSASAALAASTAAVGGDVEASPSLAAERPASPRPARVANLVAKRSGPPPQTKTKWRKEKMTTDS
mmetsp:Transcript_111331/g.311074  ORF Transcript_111331/g.311074 Transcript_111331/m.311074 type:complete len:243 (+) Transcript_111331:499-1227(+)